MLYTAHIRTIFEILSTSFAHARHRRSCAWLPRRRPQTVLFGRREPHRSARL